MSLSESGDTPVQLLQRCSILQSWEAIADPACLPCPVLWIPENCQKIGNLPSLQPVI